MRRQALTADLEEAGLSISTPHTKIDKHGHFIVRAVNSVTEFVEPIPATVSIEPVVEVTIESIQPEPETVQVIEEKQDEPVSNVPVTPQVNEDEPKTEAQVILTKETTQVEPVKATSVRKKKQ